MVWVVGLVMKTSSVAENLCPIFYISQKSVRARKDNKKKQQQKTKETQTTYK